MKKFVFVLSYYGYSNTGDDAITKGIVNHLYTSTSNGVLAHFAGNTYSNIIKKVQWSDSIIIPGGTHLRNWGNKWFYQSIRMLLFGCLVRLLGKKFYMFNIGIDGKGWEWLARRIANKITIRDRETFDSAALMNFDLSGIERKKIIGVNLTPVNQIYYNDPSEDKMIAGAVYVALDLWLKEHPDWSVKFISFNGNDKYSDDILNGATARIMGTEFVPWQSNPIKTLEEVAECSVIIGMRYHACVFAALAGLPLLGIESYPSVKQFMEKWYWHLPLKQDYVIRTVDFLDHFTAFMEVALTHDRKYKPQLSIEQMKLMAAEGIRL